MIFDGYVHQIPDIDPGETEEWLDSLDAVIDVRGKTRARYLLTKLLERAQESQVSFPATVSTPYVNTIPREQEPWFPGDEHIERRIRAFVRWNAAMMVVKANKHADGIGGHLSTFASSASLYEIGFNHFFRGKDDGNAGDAVYFQGHAAPGVYARAFMEGRLTADDLDHFRREIGRGGKGLSSYPHPRLMPEFWEYPTVSMGLGPLAALYHARFNRYLQNRQIDDTSQTRVWCFMGDGECDEPESLGAISLASREQLDNLIFVINCNLQRLDGPVRGNGKIIQELEAVFRGAGWNVIKVIWGSYWDPLLAKDTTGLLRQRMEECVDGEYQDFKSKDGAYVREHFFGKYPELLEMVADMTDEQIWALNRGGHDPIKIYAAYKEAVEHTDGPTVILAKTVKGYGMGEAGEGQNITHQQKKMAENALRVFRNRFDLSIADEDLLDYPYLKPADSLAQYMAERRTTLGGGSLPSRREKSSVTLPVPALSAFNNQLQATEGRQISTTMAFVRILNTLLRDKQIGKHIVPIVPDESRTFGMEGMFRQFGIFSQVGQLYRPQDADQLMFYKEDKKGQILQEGINEPGAMASWIAAATSYSVNDTPMIPFFIYYSMFGFQRFGDLAWAAGDSRARGFLLGGTAGRTTLNGEGLQHEDGHSHVQSSLIPNCVSYDPTFSYEVAVIVQDGLRRMIGEQEDVWYYITLMNENYEHPAMPEGVEEQILKGMYLFRAADAGGAVKKNTPRVQLLGSGTIFREVLAAADMLASDFGVAADVWSVPSFTELRREGLDVERWNRLHPTEEPKRSHVETLLADRPGPVIASTDYIKTFADQIRPFIDRRYAVLGTDGFGRSDYRKALREFFEVDRYFVTLTALHALAQDGLMPKERVAEAITKYDIDPDKPNPMRT